MKDLTGDRFGRLVALRPTAERRGSFVVWECECDCGNIARVPSGQLNQGNTRSCGCLAREMASEWMRERRKVGFKEGTSIPLISKTEPSKANTSGVVGVSWDKSRDKWFAEIIVQGKRHFLGRFDTLEDAKVARDEAKKKYHDPLIEKYRK